MPATFGQLLTAAREKRGLSVDDAAHETRIPAQRIRLLESGNVASFGSITYARSFVRSYSDYLEVDCEAFLHSLPESGLLGGERDYRYLTQTQGPWLRERASHTERLTEPEVQGLRRIKSPMPAALAVFALMLAATAMWGMHVAEASGQTEPAALKALPVEEEGPVASQPQTAQAQTAAARQMKPVVDFPVKTGQTQTVD